MVILLGTLILMLLFSSKDGQVTPFIDAIFTTTPTTCVTGLIVYDTVTYWSGFGQGVILLLIQIGGMGFITWDDIKRHKLHFKQYRMQSKVILCVTALFESASAVATVGLTIGITPTLLVVSKVVLIILMFLGRVGGLTVMFAALSNKNPNVSRLPEDLFKETSIPVLKAFNVNDLDEMPLIQVFNVNDLDEIEKYKELENIKGYVFDAPTYGSGKTFDWSLLENVKRDDKLFILAGGLNADNVAEGIKAVNPDCVDVSSGVENDNGIGKSREKIKQFVDATRM